MARLRTDSVASGRLRKRQLLRRLPAELAPLGWSVCAGSTSKRAAGFRPLPLELDATAEIAAIITPLEYIVEKEAHS